MGGAGQELFEAPECVRGRDRRDIILARALLGRRWLLRLLVLQNISN